MDDTKWECKWGKIRTVRLEGGYTDFVQHVISQQVTENNLLFTESESGKSVATFRCRNANDVSAAYISTSIFFSVLFILFASFRGQGPTLIEVSESKARLLHKEFQNDREACAVLYRTRRQTNIRDMLLTKHNFYKLINKD